MDEIDDASAIPSGARRAALARGVRLPLVSGKTSAAVLLACFALTSLIIFPLKGWLPLWVDVEILLGVWWLVWMAALTHFLHSGRRITDDHAMGAPRNWLSIFSRGKTSGSSDGGWWWLDFGNVADIEGCAVVIGIILAVVVAFVGLWLLIEIVIPGLAFLAYLLIRGMLARVANDKHGCEGNLVKSICWGAFWATVYIAPQVLFVWLVHVVYKKPAGV